MKIIHKLWPILALLTVTQSSLLAYKIHIRVDQRSSQKIHFEAKDGKNGDTIFDLRPRAGEYIFEDASDHFDKITFNIKGQADAQTVDLATMLDGGNPRGLLGYLSYLDGYVVYRLRQTFTWGNLLHLDDSAYISIEFFEVDELPEDL